MKKQEKKLASLNDKWARHFQEIYAPDTKLLVRGEGPVNARVVLVGEAPGKEEALRQRPFVGKAGQNLDAFLSGAGLERAALYVTNTVKFRPSRTGPKGTVSNRPPTAEEVALFRPWLLEEIELVAPAWIVTLGNVPLRALAGPKATIGSAHGACVGEVRGAKLFPLYHPAAVIYNPALREVCEEDLRKLKKALEG